MPKKPSHLRPVPDKPAASARAMGPTETAEAFNHDAPPADPTFQGINPNDLVGALLTNDRFLVYTTSEKRAGTKCTSYTIFRRGPITIGVFPEEAIVEEGIIGIVSDAHPEMEAVEEGGPQHA